MEQCPKLRGKALPSRAREIILNVRAYFEREKENGCPLLDVGKVVQRTSEATNVGMSTIQKLTTLKRKLPPNEKISSPKRTRNRNPPKDQPEQSSRRKSTNNQHNDTNGGSSSTTAVPSLNNSTAYEKIYIRDSDYGAEFSSDSPGQLEAVAENNDISDLAVSSTIAPSLADSLPCTDELAGDLNFELYLDHAPSKRSWLYSNKLRKVFIDINKQIVVYFKWDFEKAACNDFFIRALPVYTQGDWSTIPVERCPIHVSPEDVSNTGFAWINHVLRCESPHTLYETDEMTTRKSCITSVIDPTPDLEYISLPYKFVCKTSCYRGMQRRPVVVIFTLENIHGMVLGRRCLTFKICSCLKRDRQHEEDEFERSARVNVYNDSQQQNVSFL